MFEVLWKNDETWLICGGRDFENQEMFDSAMGDLCRIRGLPSKVVQGGARGADTMAKQWAARMAIPCETFEADWKAHGKSAGPRRNQRMLATVLDDGAPCMLVAFPGGAGTAHMVKIAYDANILVAEIHPTKHPASVPA